MAESDLERRDRIITHMNKEHVKEQTYYLRHFCNLSKSAASSPQLINLTFKGLTIRTGDGKTHTVPLTPPLQSWDEIRPRVVAMDESARKGLGISDIRIKEHRWPDRFFDRLLFFAVSFYWFCWLTSPFFKPGTLPWETMASVLGNKTPAGYLWLVKALQFPVAGIHFAEAYFFHRLRMQRHQVETGSSLWWKWMFSVWIEGASAWQRVGRVIEDAKKEKEAKGH